MASEVDEERAPANPEREVRYRWAAEQVAGMRVLDAACGSGWGTSLLAARATTAVGVDFSPAAIADARAAHGQLADFREADMRDLPFGDGEFDCVVCFEALAHVADPGRLIDELRRVLAAEGVLLISAPNRDAYPAGNPLHLSEISSAELESLLTARFTNVAVHRQQPYFASLLGDTELLAHDDPATEIDVRIGKLVGGSAGSELHAVATAGNGQLPPPPARLAIGESVDFDEQRRLLEEWRERAVEAEAKALALERELRAAQR